MLQTAKKQTDDITFDDYLSLDIKKLWLGIRAEPWSFWFLCGYFFFEYTQVQKIYPWLGFLPWGQIFILGAFFLAFISQDHKWISNPCNTAIFLFFIHIFVSSLLAFDIGQSFDYLNVIANWAIMYYCVICIISTKKRFYVLFLLLLLASFKMSQFATISWIQRGFSFMRWGVGGPPGWFGDSADMGCHILLFLAWSVAFLSFTYKRNGVYSKIFCLAMVITALCTIIATGNRGSFLGLAAIGLATLLLLPSRIRNLCAIGAIAVAIYWATPQEFLDRFDTAGKDETSTTRLELWQNGIKMGEEKPFFGVGYENFTKYGNYYFGQKLVAHNSPITVFAELGYLGLALYLYIHLTIYRVNRKTRKIAKELGDEFSAAVATSLYLGLAAYVISTLFITVPYYPFLYVQLALTAALSNIVIKQSIDQKKMASQR